MPADRYIEHAFPIVQLNPLSVRERNAFKPVYKMHKWFARRSASIFRAILLASALPYKDEHGNPTDLMAEFYKGHGDDPRLRDAAGNRLKVLDPFMGGGTTVVEGLRLGFEVTGIDLNPIAWFIVKGETTPVNLDALDAAFERLADKVKDDLLDLYRTRCPLTGEDADIIYGFWVKQGICVDPGCGQKTDLFKSYEVARKRGDATISYVPDVKCPHCAGVFDWELNRCTITAGGPQVEGIKPAGKGRPEGTRFAFSLSDVAVGCPRCGETVPKHARGIKKAKNKKVPLHVVVDPATGRFFEVRGKLPDTVTVPGSGDTLQPKADAPCVRGGKFTCSHCGRLQRIVESADAHGAPLPFRYYGFYAHTPHVGVDNDREAQELGLDTNNHKWFASASEADHARVEQAAAELERVSDSLPLPRQEIPDGRNFRDLKRQGYKHWVDVFGPRQLLALGKLLRAIGEEEDPALRDALLGAFQSHLDNTSKLTGYDFGRNMVRNVTAAHDFRNPTGIAENNVWGVAGAGRAPFSNCVEKYANGIRYLEAPTVTAEEGYDEAEGSPRSRRPVGFLRAQA